MKDEKGQETTSGNSEIASEWTPIFMLLFGIYLLIVAYAAFSSAKWPIFFTPLQLDVFGFLFSLFGDRVAGYLGGTLLGILGIACCWLGGAVMTKGSRKW